MSELFPTVAKSARSRVVSGIYGQDNSDLSVSVPLTEVNISANLLNGLTSAVVTITQTFVNKTKNPIEAVYKFPLGDAHSSAVCKFSATIGDKKLVGKCMEKKAAQQVYDDAIASGGSAFLLETSKERSDIFTTSVGNLLPGATVVIELTYVTELENLRKMNTDGEVYGPHQISFSIPTTMVAPPSTFDPDENPSETTFKEPPYKLNLNVLLDVPESSDTFNVYTPTHQDVAIISGDKKNISISNRPLDGNFVLIVEHNIPKLEISQDEKAVVFHVLPQYPMDLKISKGDEETDICIVLDQSGSMSGELHSTAIEGIKQILELSKNQKVKLNIFRFGSDGKFLLDSFVAVTDSGPYSPDDLISSIKKFKNMYGTDLKRAFQMILGQLARKSTIFLFSDAEISGDKDQELVDLIQKWLQKEQISIYPIGIGNSPNTHLIRELGRVGHGFSEFCAVSPNNPNINRENVVCAVLRQWARAFSSLKNVSFRFLDQNNEPILTNNLISAPFNLPPLISGIVQNIYTFNQSNDKQKTLQALEITANLRDGTPYISKIATSDHKANYPFNVNEKLTARGYIREMGLYYDNNPTIKNNIVELAVHYTIASSYTSFVAVEEPENNPETLLELKLHVIPTLSPKSLGQVSSKDKTYWVPKDVSLLPTTPTSSVSPRLPARTLPPRDVTTRPVPARTPPPRDVTKPPPREVPARVVPPSVSIKPGPRIIQKEKKTDYWQSVVSSIGKEYFDQESLETIISRSMSLGVVGDILARERGKSPQPIEVLPILCDTMRAKITELGHKPPEFGIDVTLTQQAVLLDKKLNEAEEMERKNMEEERKRFDKKIAELEALLRRKEEEAVAQKESNKRALKSEIERLRVEIDNARDDPERAKALLSKQARVEAALRLMLEERKKVPSDDKETILLKRKLQLFEDKRKSLEEESKMKANAADSAALREKLILMEDKLAKMEKRKSTSMTQQINAKMEAVSKQLDLLKGEKGHHGGDVDAKIEKKMELLAKQLESMKTVNTPVVDEETVALRSHIAKLESNLLESEKKLEAERNKMTRERAMAQEKRRIEEEEFRKKSAEREEMLLARMSAMEAKIATTMSVASAEREEMLLAKLSAMEASIAATGSVASELKLDTDELSARVERKLLDEGMKERESARMRIEKRMEERRKEKDREEESRKERMGEREKRVDTVPDWKIPEDLSKLEDITRALMAREDHISKLIDAKMMSLRDTEPGSIVKSGLTMEGIYGKLREIQIKLSSPDIDERESEVLNIEYEKLSIQLETMDDYQKEQTALEDKWKEDNLAANKEAFERVSSLLKAMSETQLKAVFTKKPLLRLLLRTPEQIMKAYGSDFKVKVGVYELSMEECRALLFHLPCFRKDQLVQKEFVAFLRERIEQLLEKQKGRERILPSRTVVIKVSPSPSFSDVLDALLLKTKSRMLRQ
eukprot:TRINITY_DN4546_c0_g1_i1.p1 TRINITY_DN4546_c0_g1~~TRINITY_DN4546_c0_g1_i1.p1  ORF type:complete len:1457 (+),score=497.48 TRINITY_DN4546_c0_g1_i1:44-4372(+)